MSSNYENHPQKDVLQLSKKNTDLNLESPTHEKPTECMFLDQENFFYRIILLFIYIITKRNA
jgi:hypothetical protein